MISLLTSSVVDLGLCPSQVKQLTKTANMANKKYCLIWLTLSGGDIVFVQIWCNYRYNYIYVHMCIMLGIVFANNNNLKTRFPSSFTPKMLLFLHTDSIVYQIKTPGSLRVQMFTYKCRLQWNWINQLYSQAPGREM
jgi:hypothetical protein